MLTQVDTRIGLRTVNHHKLIILEQTVLLNLKDFHDGM
jgi:hypothetical protein